MAINNDIFLPEWTQTIQLLYANQFGGPWSENLQRSEKYDIAADTLKYKEYVHGTQSTNIEMKKLFKAPWYTCVEIVHNKCSIKIKK